MWHSGRMASVFLIGPEIEENLGLRYLASSLASAGHAVEILAFNGELELPLVRDRVLGAPRRPEVVALCLAYQWRALDFLALALALREAGYRGHVTVGGHFATFAALDLLAEFSELDSVCRHESEELLVELVGAVAEGRPLAGIAGLAIRGDDGRPRLGELRVPPDLARLPWPDRRGEPTWCLGHRVAPLVGSRGCYAGCAFCCIAAWHGQASAGPRFRQRPVSDVADEMAWLRRERGVEIFVFHDDNFFLPRPVDSLERIRALARALGERGVDRVATIVKARPNDVTPEVFTAMRDELGCLRVFLGVESDAHRGLVTLGRKLDRAENHAAMRVLADLGLYVCFNLLLFDPDSGPAELEDNLAFLEAWGDSPCNFGRVELYAGTPLLARMQREGRARGDYLSWDYSLATPEMERVFRLAMRCFHARNFAGGALANRLTGTRFDVEVCRRYHADLFRPAWLAEARAISLALSRGSAAGLRRVLGHVLGGGGDDEALVADLCSTLRDEEAALLARAEALEGAVRQAVGATCRHALPAAPRG